LKTLLELTHKEAREAFLKQESYCSVELPKYFNFQPLLDALSQNGNIGSISLVDAKS
jgi:RNA-directed DNA polymerase